MGEFEVEPFFRRSPTEIVTVETRCGNHMRLGTGLRSGSLPPAVTRTVGNEVNMAAAPADLKPRLVSLGLENLQLPHDKLAAGLREEARFRQQVSN